MMRQITRALLIVYCISSFVTRDSSRVDVTPSINPVYDGYVTCIRKRAELVYADSHGMGQACYDSWVSVAHGQQTREVLLESGINSTAAKEALPFLDDAYLVDVVGAKQLVMNGICPAAFPLKEQPYRGASGNVLLYDANQQEFTNLTAVGRDEDRFARAVRVFAKEGLVLIEYCRLRSSDHPMPGDVIEAIVEPIPKPFFHVSI